MDDQTYQKLPKKIFSFWMQGVSVAPEIVQFNWDRWRHLNPDFELIILENDSVKDTMSWIPFDSKSIPLQTYSDILRYHLLQKFGGIWVDATVFPTVPLREWLPEVIDGANFFAFSSPDIPRNRLLLDNWFIVANRNSIIIKKLLDNSILYWEKSRTMFDKGEIDDLDPFYVFKETLPDGKFSGRHQYFWSHYLFEYLVEEDESFSSEWSSVKKCSANIPVEMQWYFLRNENAFRSFLIKYIPFLNKYMLKKYKNKSPVHKLDWRKSYPVKIMSEI